MKKTKNNKMAIYQSRSGSLAIKASLHGDTLWLTQQQTAELFDVQKAAISKHVKNIFVSGELAPNATVSKMETVQKEGMRSVKRTVEYYNLDLIISIGYRVNSKQATHFRQWATKTLKEYIQQGFAINRQRVKANYDAFLTAVENVKSLLPMDSIIDNKQVLELITLFADTWFSLDAYDRDKLVVRGATKKRAALTADKLTNALIQFKKVLISKKQATDIFGVEREKGSVIGIVGNVMQSFDGHDLYPSIEEKAAHLIYFIIKNHPFIDGNKRSGAYAFIWFLNHAKVLNVKRVTPPALTALTLLIAESSPKDKERMIALVCTVLSK